MSLARKYPGESDIYMYESVDGFVVCQECKLGGNQRFDRHVMPGVRLFTWQEAYEHLLKHKKAGHLTPEGAINCCKLSAEAGDKLKPNLCDTLDCGKFSVVSYPTLKDGKSFYRQSCEEHEDFEAQAVYKEWLDAKYPDRRKP